MPDHMSNHWTAIVREHMPTLDLPETEQQAVIAELAAHLEDLYNEQIQNGGTESEARKKVMNEVAQWRPLARKIQHAKSKEKTMNPRTRQLWLPSLVSLTTAMLSLMAMTTLGKPYLFYSHHVITTVYFPWLASLPLCGAAAAYLSARAGGARRARLASTLCPAIALLAVFCFIFMAGIVGADHALTFNGFLLFVWNWVFLPGTSLLLGALPFLSEQKPSPTF